MKLPRCEQLWLPPDVAPFKIHVSAEERAAPMRVDEGTTQGQVSSVEWLIVDKITRRRGWRGPVVGTKQHHLNPKKVKREEAKRLGSSQVKSSRVEFRLIREWFEPNQPNLGILSPSHPIPSSYPIPAHQLRLLA